MKSLCLAVSANRAAPEIAALFDACFDAVAAQVRGLAHGRGEAEEFALGAIEKAWTSRKPVENWRAWLGRTARNLALDARKRACKRHERSLERIPVGDNEREVAETESDNKVEALDLFAHIRRIVGSLPGDERRAFQERAVEGRTFREIGKRMRLPFSTVAGLVASAAAQVRQALGRDPWFHELASTAKFHRENTDRR